MRLTKKCVILLILLNILFITGTYASSSSLILENSSNINTNKNTSSDSVILNNNASVNGSANILSNSIITENNSSNSAIVTPNPDNNYVPPKKDEVQDYFAELAIEGESVTEFMSKIDGSKLLEAICNQQTALGNTWMEDNKNNIAQLNIQLRDGDIRDGAQMTAEVSCNLLNNTNIVIKSSNNYVHTGITAACFMTMKNGDENGFNMGELKISLKGDISGQGDIGVVDLSLMQQELVDEINLKEEFLRAADMDTSYEIDVIDLSMLQDYIVNN